MGDTDLKGLQPRNSIGWFDGTVKYIDQRLLPNKLEVVETDDWRVLVRAIKTLAVRGAPLIGVTAAFAVAAAAVKFRSKGLKTKLRRVIDTIEIARPTAVNLSWAVKQMRSTLENTPDDGDIKRNLTDRAIEIFEDDRQRCEKLGEYGATVIPDKGRVLTICNTGFLAAAGIGTALAAVYKAHDQNREPFVFPCETRPLLQGARLTAWELHQAGIPFNLIVDSNAANLVRDGKIDVCIIGADRIANNGDSVNKIGSYQLALACKTHGVPFYVSAPMSTVDMSCPSGREIPIEERSGEEISRIGGRHLTPDGISVFNPAFDCVPVGLISGIITEKGIVKPPVNFARDNR